MIAAIYDWSGFYIGANGGWGSSRKCWDHDTARRRIRRERRLPRCDRRDAGGQIGYRWQAGTWVFGLEGQGNWADFSGSNVSLLAPAATNQFEDRRVRPPHRPDRLRRQQRPALRQGRRRW